ncbi:MAG: DUF3164 family protein [Sphingobacteriaceae bacterium]|nr:DUF3164 family protein [Sphingobacteriaceae bacterium]
MNIENLNPQERKALMDELAAQEKAEKVKVSENRKAYKTLVNEVIPPLAELLIEISETMAEAKTHVNTSLSQLINMKAEVYNKSEDLCSHSFSTDDGQYTLTVGYRLNDGYDDTVHTGIAKINDYLSSLAKDKETDALVKLVLRLLSKDAKGNLKASRVLQLKKMADDTGNAEFIDAINIIQESYRPVRTKTFISLRHNGKDVGLSMSDV